MKKFRLVILLTFMVLVFANPSAIIGRSTKINTSSSLEVNLLVTFKENLVPQEVLIVLQETGGELVAYNHIAKLGDEVISGGYFVQSKNPNGILEDYKNSHLGFLKDLASAKDREVESLDSIAKEAFDHHLALIETELAKQDPFQDVKIESIIVKGDENVKDQLISTSEVAKIQIISQVGENPISHGQKGTGGPKTAGVDPTKWVPAQGTSYIYPSNAGGRYVQQNMYWNSWWNVSGFGANSTYEHDSFLNNYDGKTYLSASQAIDGIPIVNYWSSNLPRPYLDTRIGDPSGEKAYTIGSADAFYIWPYQQYWYYVRTSNGNTSTDNGKIDGQLGYRYPSWCYTTWCSYGDSSTPIQRIVPSWRLLAPGTYNWSR